MMLHCQMIVISFIGSWCLCPQLQFDYDAAALERSQHHRNTFIFVSDVPGEQCHCVAVLEDGLVGWHDTRSAKNAESPLGS